MKHHRPFLPLTLSVSALAFWTAAALLAVAVLGWQGPPGARAVSEADAKIVSQTLSGFGPDKCPTATSPGCTAPFPYPVLYVSENKVITVEKHVHNDGPTSPLDVTLTNTGTINGGPGGYTTGQCTIAPNPGGTPLTLPFSVDTPFNENFTINCAKGADAPAGPELLGAGMGRDDDADTLIDEDPIGGVGRDDDLDTLVDEDGCDGLDNDGDGAFDEDPANGNEDCYHAEFNEDGVAPGPPFFTRTCGDGIDNIPGAPTPGLDASDDDCRQDTTLLCAAGVGGACLDEDSPYLTPEFCFSNVIAPVDPDVLDPVPGNNTEMDCQKVLLERPFNPLFSSNWDENPATNPENAANPPLDNDCILGDPCELLNFYSIGFNFCTDAADSDGDGFVNDGCPTVGLFPESGVGGCLNTIDEADEDPGVPVVQDDTVINDGCPAVGPSEDSLTLAGAPTGAANQSLARSSQAVPGKQADLLPLGNSLNDYAIYVSKGKADPLLAEDGAAVNGSCTDGVDNGGADGFDAADTDCSTPNGTLTAKIAFSTQISNPALANNHICAIVFGSAGEFMHDAAIPASAGEGPDSGSPFALQSPAAWATRLQSSRDLRLVGNHFGGFGPGATQLADEAVWRRYVGRVDVSATNLVPVNVVVMNGHLLTNPADPYYNQWVYVGITGDPAAPSGTNQCAATQVSATYQGEVGNSTVGTVQSGNEPRYFCGLALDPMRPVAGYPANSDDDNDGTIDDGSFAGCTGVAVGPTGRDLRTCQTASPPGGWLVTNRWVRVDTGQTLTQTDPNTCTPSESDVQVEKSDPCAPPTASPTPECDEPADLPSTTPITIKVTNGGAAGNVDVSVSLIGPDVCDPRLVPNLTATENDSDAVPNPAGPRPKSVDTFGGPITGGGTQSTTLDWTMLTMLGGETRTVTRDYVITCPLGGPYDFQIEVNVNGLFFDPNTFNNQAQNHPRHWATDDDLDNDTVPNATDNCLSVPNASQADQDSDGIGDACDPDFESEANLEVLSVGVSAPATANINVPFAVNVDSAVRNNGPYSPTNADVTVNLIIPNGCSAYPPGSQLENDMALAISVAVPLPTKTWMVTCTQTLTTVFSAAVTIAVDQLHVSDPQPGNNILNGNGSNPTGVNLPDADGDGVPDGFDACPGLLEDLDGYQDSDGCPDTDNDLDGVCDSGVAPLAGECSGSDFGRVSWVLPLPAPQSCRNVAEDVDSFHDGDGCPEPDNDNDGFPDSTDDCPATDYTAGTDGVADTGDEPLDILGVPIKTKEDYDGVLDTDGCHDSPGDDYDGDALSDEDEVLTYGTDPTDRDTDDDRIDDGVDGLAARGDRATVLSNSFTDVPGGTTAGTITDAGGTTVHVFDVGDPTGVRVAVSGAGGPASVSACSSPPAVYTLTPGDVVDITCSSAVAQVISGPVQMTFGSITATLPSITSATVNETAPGTFQVTAGGVSPINVGGLSVTPGQTVTVSDPDTDGQVNQADADDDGDRVLDADEGPCGGNTLNAALQPERLDTPGDDDGDTVANEALPAGSEAFDCDGDGWKGNQENLVYDDAPGTARDQDPCGNNGWAADLDPDNKLNIGDINSFTSPARSVNDGHGVFNKFGHPLDDTPPFGMTEDAAMARWNLDSPPHTPTTGIDIGDLNAINPGVSAPTARPPMLGGQPAFFTNGGMCPYAP